MNINIFKQNNKFYFNEDKFYNKKQDLVKAISRELGYPHKEALKYVNNKLGKPTSKKDKEEYYKNKIMMLERRVAYLEDKLNEKPIVSCEVSKPKIEWVKPEPIEEPEPIKEPEPIDCNEELKNSQNEYLINMNETKRLLALLEEPDLKMCKTCKWVEKENNNNKIFSCNSCLDNICLSCAGSFARLKKYEKFGGYCGYCKKENCIENEKINYKKESEEYYNSLPKNSVIWSLTTPIPVEEVIKEKEEEKISDNNIDMTKPIINVNKDNLEKITLRDNDTNKFQHFYKYVLREDGKQVKIIILTKLLQKVGVCKLWIDKNIDEEFRDEEDCINLDGEELYEIIITVPELCRLDKQLFREFKYTPHYNNLTDTNEYFEGWVTQ